MSEKVKSEQKAKRFHLQRFWNWFWPQLCQEPLKKLANVAAIGGVIVAIVGLILSNQHTERQIAIANMQLELATRPYLHVVGARWHDLKTTSGDVGTQVGFIVQNLGEKPARNVHTKKDFIIRITAQRDKARLAKMLAPSDTLNQEQEAFLNQYLLYRETPIKELAAFFRTAWKGQGEKTIEQYFNEKWQREGKDYQCEVYGSVEDRYAPPWTMPPGQQEIWIGRSTLRPASMFAEPGGDLLFAYLILEYRSLLKTDRNYQLHYIGYFDSTQMETAGGTLYPIAKYTTWDELDVTP